MTIDPTVKQQINKILSTQFRMPEKNLTPETSFVDDLFADSLDIVEIMMSLEETFDIPIDDTHADEMATIGDVYTFISYGLKLKSQDLTESEVLELLHKRLLEK